MLAFVLLAVLSNPFSSVLQVKTQSNAIVAARLVIQFDPAYLEVIDALPDVDGVQLEPLATSLFPVITENVVDNQRGTIKYTSGRGPKSTVKGDIPMARVTFKAKAPGETMVTVFTGPHGSSAKGIDRVEMPVETRNLMVDIKGEQLPVLIQFDRQRIEVDISAERKPTS